MEGVMECRISLSRNLGRNQEKESQQQFPMAFEKKKPEGIVKEITTLNSGTFNGMNRKNVLKEIQEKIHESRVKFEYKNPSTFCRN